MTSSTIDNNSNVALIAEKIFLLAQSLPNPPIIGFIAARKGEGTTFTIKKTALAAANIHQKTTMLIDCCRDRGLSREFGIEQEPGIRELSSDSVTVSNIVKDIQEGIYVVPSGNPDISIALHGLSALLSDSGVEPDAFFLDLPPVLNSTTAFEISSMINGFIMVVEAHKTRREIVLRAREELMAHSGKELMGCILNRRKFIIPKALYDMI